MKRDTSEATSSNRVLSGLTVIDLSTYVAGGFTTLMLANQGADVIKVERPGVGDGSRHWGPPFVDSSEYDGPGRSAAEEGESTYFWTVNYGKRSIELDLTEEEGTATLYDLVSDADVFVENFRPGTAQRLDVGYEALREHNEELVYCSISAFGETGPWSDRPGYDLLVQGMSGIMSVTGYPDEPPAKVGVPATDLIVAMWSAFGILNALYRRERTGTGDRVELGMLDAALPWLTKQAGKAFVGETPGRMGTKDPVIAPYQTFPTDDGHLNVACGSQRLFEELCRGIGRADLIDDDRFATNADRVTNQGELESELSAEFEKKPTREWIEELAGERDLPVGPVFDVPTALDNDQVNARGMVEQMERDGIGEIPVVEHPINYDDADAGFEAPPPMLGEHTESVLQAFGYDEDRIEALRDAGVIPEEPE
ncbi:MAG: CaiB/BaiF CoA transferase family protein [Halodesulfurarchaeum sp.]